MRVKGESEQQLLPPLPADPVDPLDPVACSKLGLYLGETLLFQKSVFFVKGSPKF